MFSDFNTWKAEKLATFSGFLLIFLLISLVTFIYFATKLYRESREHRPIYDPSMTWPFFISGGITFILLILLSAVS